jgi:signal transduction histidine kinase
VSSGQRPTPATALHDRHRHRNLSPDPTPLADRLVSLAIIGVLLASALVVGARGSVQTLDQAVPVRPSVGPPLRSGVEDVAIAAGIESVRQRSTPRWNGSSAYSRLESFNADVAHELRSP